MNLKPDERKRLERFVALADKIINSRFVQQTTNLKVEMKFEIGKPSEQILEGVDEDSMRSALIDIRKLLLEKDGTKFTDICDIVINNAPNDTVKTTAVGWRGLYDGLMNNVPPIHITTGETLHKNEKILSDWIYGYYIHEDEDKAQSLESTGILLTMHKYMFVNTILILARFAHGLAEQAKLVISASS